jgi:putative copper resistance protein D
VVGYLFWRPVVGIEPSRHPLSPPLQLVYLALAVPVDTFTGLTLTSTTHELFSFYNTFTRSWGPSLVTDLHIGGSIMWVGGDALMFIAMIPVAIRWVRVEEQRSREVDAEFDRLESGSGGASV